MQRALGIGLWMLLVWQCAAALWAAPWNPDAGYYLPLARRVAAGEAPYRDFPSLYPPGAYYLLALLGQRGLSEPTVVKAALITVQLLNLALLATILRRWRFDRDTVLIYAALCGLWTMRAEGAFVALEPFQNLYLLLALLACLRGDSRSYLAAGLAAGFALCVKQFALLALPGLLCVALHPPDPSDKSSSTDRLPQRWLRPLMALVAVPIPFLTFALLTGQSPMELCRHLASYGGEAREYGVTGLKALYLNVVETNGPAWPLLAFAALGVWLWLREPSWLNVGLLALLMGGAAPLYVRDFAHYVQMSIPWAVLIAARWSRAIGEDSTVTSNSGAARFSPALATAGLLLLPVVIQGTAQATRDLWQRPDQQQRALAVRLPQTLAQVRSMALDDPALRLDVTVFNGEWLYPLANLRPPGGDCHFYDAAYVARRQDQPPTLVVATPGRYSWSTLDGWARRLGLAPVYVETQTSRDGQPATGAASGQPILKIYATAPAPAATPAP